MNENHLTDNNFEDRPPLLGSWRRLYFVILLELAALIALFWLFSRAFQ